MRVDENVYFYSCYASAVIDGDRSGLTESEGTELDFFLAQVRESFGSEAYIFDATEFGFSNRTATDGWQYFNRLAGDLSVYAVASVA